MAPPAAPDWGHAPPALTAAAVLQACPELALAGRLWVGFSGGLDSSVLLHLVSELRRQQLLTMPLGALHIHHGLQAAADEWEQECVQFAAQLDVSFTSIHVHVDTASAESPEEAARSARYQAFAETLAADDMLLLAHHRDDQVETVLFRLFRGGGPAGLAGMPRSRPCGRGQLSRPLLAYPRSALLAYAGRHELAWIEDASNQLQRYDRNFLRAAILPALRQRWPGLSTGIIRSATLSGEAAILQDHLAALDLAALTGPRPNRLQAEPLLALDPVRQRNVLRFWLRSLQPLLSIAPATHQVLHRIVPEVLLAAPDAEPVLRWGRGPHAAELRRFGGMLYALPVLPDALPGLPWNGRQPLVLPAPLGVLTFAACDAATLASLPPLEIRFRSGGEKFREAGRPTRSLKKILHECAVPPWMRNRIPLLYADNELAAIGDLLVSARWREKVGEHHCHLTWQRPDLDCGY